MEGPFVAKVLFRPHKNCFISVPQEWIPISSKDTRTAVFEVQYDVQQKAYFSCSGETTSSTQSGSEGQWTVEINGFYALKLGIHEGQEVVITRKSDIAVAIESLDAEPLAVDDWEILELHSNYVQNNLMNQVRVVWNGQLLPIWVTQSVCIFVKIGGLHPRCLVGLLEQLTSVHVTPKTRDANGAQQLDFTNPLQGFPKEIENKNSMNVSIHGEIQNGTQDYRSQWALSEHLQKVFGGWFNKQKTEPHVSSRSDVSAKDSRQDVETHFGKLQHDKLFLRVHPWNHEDTLDEMSNVQEKHRILFQRYNIWPLLIQPTTVIVSSQNFNHSINFMNERNPVVIGQITKIPMAIDLLEKKEKQKVTVEGTAKSKTEDSSSPHALNSQSTVSLKNRTHFVKVVILDFLWDYLEDSSVTESIRFMLHLKKSLTSGVILVQDTLQRQIGCEITSKVQLSFYTQNVVQPMTVHFHPLQTMVKDFSKEDMDKEIRIWLKDHTTINCPAIITNGDLFEILSSTGKALHFVAHSPETQKLHKNTEALPILISAMTNVCLQSDTVVDDQSLQRTVQFSEVPVTGHKSAELGGVTEHLRCGVTHLMLDLRLGSLSRTLWSSTTPTSAGSGLLVCGSRGSGKTALARSLTGRLYRAPFFVFATVVSCKSLKGKRVETVARLWKRTYREALYRSPSIVVLDDLDHLAGCPSGPENEIGAAAHYQARLAEVLSEILKGVSTSEEARVSTVATCKSVASLHPMLATPQGTHFFRRVLNLTSPSAAHREEILRSLILSKPTIATSTLDAVDWRSLAARTEGFAAGDLEAIVDGATHAASTRKQSRDSPGHGPEAEWALSDPDFEKALANFQPASLRGLRLHDAGAKGWQDVGGLARVKRVLVETLQWPTKYPRLFERCPMAPRSGLLLYGPPGTGKTLLAAVVAKECGMHFIGVKGPELLSKYIGASEQSVRELFERASEAKPCIIFFDEFESLAPRRGHDSTGVTDRVVNQLLVQMDGVEGRRGVYVLAATSRPDLIDPALLRPGRLDKILYCPLPSAVERLEILRVSCSEVTLSEDVDLAAIADACANYSGADLRGLLCDAQLNAIHRTYDTGGRPGLQSDEAISSEDVDESLDRPDSEWAVVHLAALEDGVAIVDERSRDAVQQQLDTISSSIYGWPTDLDDRSTDATGKSPVVISKDDFAAALRNSKPSVSEVRRQQYEAKYEAFRKSETQSLQNEMRATMA